MIEVFATAGRQIEGAASSARALAAYMALLMIIVAGSGNAWSTPGSDRTKAFAAAGDPAGRARAPRPDRACVQSAGSTASARPESREQLRYALLIGAVLLAEEGDEVAFLEHEGSHHVGGEQRGEREAVNRHHRRGPEGDQEAELHRVTHEAVDVRRLEARLGDAAPRRVSPGLAQAEELEVVDEEGREQHGRPAESEHAPDDAGAGRVLDAPHRPRKGLP